MTDLDDLIARVEKASGPDRELDAEVCCAIGPLVEGRYVSGARPSDNHAGLMIRYFTDGGHGTCVAPSVTSSLDAAMSLIDWAEPKEWGYYFTLEQDWEHIEKWVARADQHGDECGHGDTIMSQPCAGKALAVTSFALRCRKDR